MCFDKSVHTRQTGPRLDPNQSPCFVQNLKALHLLTAKIRGQDSRHGRLSGYLRGSSSCSRNTVEELRFIVNPRKLETGLRRISAGIPYTWVVVKIMAPFGVSIIIRHLFF